MTMPTVPYSDVWRWNTQTSPPTSNGQLRTTSGDWTASVTELWITKLSDTTTDASASLAALGPGSAIYLEHNTDPTRWAQFDVTAVPTDDGTYFAIPVTYQDGAGNLPNSSTRILVEFLASTASEGGTADWSMQYLDGTHWASVVVCKHGQSSAGVWLQFPIEDDRNFLDQAEPAYANHLALFGCDCPLEIIWTPSYVPPPPPPPELDVVPATEQPAPEPRAGSSAAFQIWANYPKLYGGRVTCPHGWAQSGCWRGSVGWPDLLQVQEETYRNHQRLFGCGDLLAPSDNTAALTLNALTVARGVLQPVPEASGVVTGSALQWNGSRLSVQQPVVLGITASISLARNVPQGAGGFVHLLIQGVSFARAPILQAGAQAVGTVTWSGQLPVGYALRVGYENSSPMAYQDVLAGGTLNASSITVLAPLL